MSKPVYRRGPRATSDKFALQTSCGDRTHLNQLRDTASLNCHAERRRDSGLVFWWKKAISGRFSGLAFRNDSFRFIRGSSDRGARALTKRKNKLPLEELLTELPLADKILSCTKQSVRISDSDWRRERSFARRKQGGEGEDRSFSIPLASSARLEILIRLLPEQAFSEALTNDGFISEDTIEGLRKQISNVSDGILMKGVKSSKEKLRYLSLTSVITSWKYPDSTC